MRRATRRRLEVLDAVLWPGRLALALIEESFFEYIRGGPFSTPFRHHAEEHVLRRPVGLGRPLGLGRVAEPSGARTRRAYCREQRAVGAVRTNQGS